jgi:hypothetical protein
VLLYEHGRLVREERAVSAATDGGIRMNRTRAGFRRRLSLSAAAALLTVSTMSAAPAQMGGGMKNRIIDDIAGEMVTSINGSNCAQFEAMLKKKKSGGGSKGGGMLKSDPAARARFVDKVAGPLVNKMIDCNLLPGR